MGKKYIDSTWDFRKADTKEYTHCFHSYPAMMIPQVARMLIERYGKECKLLFDPYVGTGTSLVEANLKGINAIGTDLNPLAGLIARSKTSIIKIKTLNLYLKKFEDLILEFEFGKVNYENVTIPDFYNIDYWFDKEVQYQLAIIKDFINKIKYYKVKDYFNVGFSETIRETSWTRNSEFKLYRMSEKQREKFHPKVFNTMIKKLYRNKKGLEEFINKRNGNVSSKIYKFNTIDKIPKNYFKGKVVDIIVTSPPYGDSRTTVAYGQFSRLANQWLDFKEAKDVDKILMGGIRNKEIKSFQVEILDDIINKMFLLDEKRTQEVISFYLDYRKSISNVSKIVRKGSYVCYVVGNRRVKGITLPTDEITRMFFEENGYEHIETIIRNIPNKRMPSKNSPSNKPGQVDTTMTNEFIVVMKKII